MKNIIRKAGLTEEERLAVAALCDGPCSAQGLAHRLGLSHFIRVNLFLGRAGRKVFDASPVGSVIRRWHPKRWGDRGWYHVLAPGWRSEIDRKFYWELRPGVARAFVELEWHAPLRRAKSRADGIAKFEGAEVLRLISARERDPGLRAECLRVHGFRCLVCDMDMGERYGEFGRGLVHVHHLTPLARSSGPIKTDASKDLIPVCPNCRSVIHRGGRLLSPRKVRDALRSPNKAPAVGLAHL